MFIIKRTSKLQQLFQPIARNIKSSMSKGEYVSPNPKRYHFFNFFEKPSIGNEAFFKKWMIPGNYCNQQPEYVSMHLHNDPTSAAKYPWVNFVVVDSEDSIIFGKPDPEWIKIIQAGFKDKHVNLPAGYREISSLRGNNMDSSEKKRSDETRFILVALKVDHKIISTEKFQTLWTSFSGVNSIENEANVVDALLYEKFLSKFGPGPLFPKTFEYVVRVELNQVENEEKCQSLLEKVKESCEKNSTDGIATFSGLYRIHHNM